MVAPRGNQFWKMRSSHGRKPKFSSPEVLEKACEEYFEWVEKHPLYESKAFPFQGEVTVKKIPKMRAMTVNGLCLFLDIDHTTWGDYRKKPKFRSVVARVDEVIRHQKFIGAAAELLNPNIIAKDLGLADKKELEHSGPVQVTIMKYGKGDPNKNTS